MVFKELKEFEISSISDFMNIARNLASTNLYRGQGSIEDTLIPKIARDNIWTFTNKLKHREESILGKFKRFATPYIDPTPKSDFDWNLYAQHYGLPTRLLDFSSNPLKALFFAVNDLNNQNDGVLWGVVPTFWVYSGFDFAKIDDDNSNVYFFFPDHIHPRVQIQESCFAVFPLPDPEKSQTIPPLEVGRNYKGAILELNKIKIPFLDKETILLELDYIGINTRTLFPGLEGLSQQIVWDENNKFSQ